MCLEEEGAGYSESVRGINWKEVGFILGLFAVAVGTQVALGIYGDEGIRPPLLALIGLVVVVVALGLRDLWRRLHER